VSRGTCTLVFSCFFWSRLDITIVFYMPAWPCHVPQKILLFLTWTTLEELRNHSRGMTQEKTRRGYSPLHSKTWDIVTPLHVYAVYIESQQYNLLPDVSISVGHDTPYFTRFVWYCWDSWGWGHPLTSQSPDFGPKRTENLQDTNSAWPAPWRGRGVAWPDP